MAQHSEHDVARCCCWTGRHGSVFQHHEPDEAGCIGNILVNLIVVIGISSDTNVVCVVCVILIHSMHPDPQHAPAGARALRVVRLSQQRGHWRRARACMCAWYKRATWSACAQDEGEASWMVAADKTWSNKAAVWASEHDDAPATPLPPRGAPHTTACMHCAALHVLHGLHALEPRDAQPLKPAKHIPAHTVQRRHLLLFFQQKRITRALPALPSTACKHNSRQPPRALPPRLALHPLHLSLHSACNCTAEPADQVAQVALEAQAARARRGARGWRCGCRTARRGWLWGRSTWHSTASPPTPCPTRRCSCAPTRCRRRSRRSTRSRCDRSACGLSRSDVFACSRLAAPRSSTGPSWCARAHGALQAPPDQILSLSPHIAECPL